MGRGRNVGTNHHSPKRAVGANHHSPVQRKRKAQTRPKRNRGARPKPLTAGRGRKPREDGRPKAQAVTPRRKQPALPPPESEVWPIWCRGELWDPATAKYYIGRCQLCEHACRPSERRRKINAMSFVSTPLLCTEHPESPGKLREVMPTDTCRNFRQVRKQTGRTARRENLDPRAVDWSAPEYKEGRQGQTYTFHTLAASVAHCLAPPDFRSPDLLFSLQPPYIQYRSPSPLSQLHQGCFSGAYYRGRRGRKQGRSSGRRPRRSVEAWKRGSVEA